MKDTKDEHSVECVEGCRYLTSVWTNSWENPFYTYTTHTEGCPADPKTVRAGELKEVALKVAK